MVGYRSWSIREASVYSFTPGLYKKHVGGEDVIWQMNIVATKTTVGISQGIFFFFKTE